MNNKDNIIGKFILSLSKSLNDEEIYNLKVYCPSLTQVICSTISDYICTLSKDESEIEKLFLKDIINKLI